MPDPQPMLRDISDTARWVAVYRARETERPDALFRDPLARKLAGERGEEIAKQLAFARDSSWPFVARTWQFDQFIMQQVQQGADMVINLAAGLDARPYRMELPSSLQWIEVDLPALIQYKQAALANERPRCKLERIALDLADVDARRALFQRLASRSRMALIITEGLLIYLPTEEVGVLARDLAAQRSFQRWAIDLASPGLLQLMAKRVSDPLREAGMPLQFAPQEGPDFFNEFGWQTLEVHLMLKIAAKIKRLPMMLRLLAMLPQPDRPKGNRPWGGICLLGRR